MLQPEEPGPVVDSGTINRNSSAGGGSGGGGSSGGGGGGGGGIGDMMSEMQKKLAARRARSENTGQVRGGVSRVVSSYEMWMSMFAVQTGVQKSIMVSRPP